MKLKGGLQMNISRQDATLNPWSRVKMTVRRRRRESGQVLGNQGPAGLVGLCQTVKKTGTARWCLKAEDGKPQFPTISNQFQTLFRKS
jgi:hypothetical protein